MAAIVENIELSSNIRVALIIEAGRIKPVWFEERDKLGRDRVFIKKVCQTWNHQEGSAKVINFAVQDECNTYKLSLNTREFTWRCGVAETSSF
jgi:hypothetical protein